MDDFIEKHFIPLLSTCINSSDDQLALDALKAANELVNYYSLDNLVQSLNNALLHKSKDVAYFALEVLRMKRSQESITSIAPSEYKKLLLDVVIPFLFTSFIPQVEKTPVKTDEGIESQISEILIRNPKFAERLKDIRSKYCIE